MRKKYVSPLLIVDEYVQDTMIASSKPFPYKNGNPGNQNCYTSRDNLTSAASGDNVCMWYPNEI